MSEEPLTDFEKALKQKLGSKKVFICNGPECTIAGTQKPLKKWLLEYFDEDDMGTLNCIGLCHKNYSFRLNGKKFSAKTQALLNDILKEEGFSEKA